MWTADGLIQAISEGQSAMEIVLQRRWNWFTFEASRDLWSYEAVMMRSNRRNILLRRNLLLTILLLPFIIVTILKIVIIIPTIMNKNLNTINMIYIRDWAWVIWLCQLNPKIYDDLIVGQWRWHERWLWSLAVYLAEREYTTRTIPPWTIGGSKDGCQ